MYRFLLGNMLLCMSIHATGISEVEDRAYVSASVASITNDTEHSLLVVSPQNFETFFNGYEVYESDLLVRGATKEFELGDDSALYVFMVVRLNTPGKELMLFKDSKQIIHIDSKDVKLSQLLKHIA